MVAMREKRNKESPKKRPRGRNHVHDVRGHQSEVGSKCHELNLDRANGLCGRLISCSRAPGHYVMGQVALEEGVKAIFVFSGGFWTLPSQGKLS